VKWEEKKNGLKKCAFGGMLPRPIRPKRGSQSRGQKSPQRQKTPRAHAFDSSRNRGSRSWGKKNQKRLETPLATGLDSLASQGLAITENFLRQVGFLPFIPLHSFVLRPGPYSSVEKRIQNCDKSSSWKVWSSKACNQSFAGGVEGRTDIDRIIGAGDMILDFLDFDWRRARDTWFPAVRCPQLRLEVQLSKC
jgi:hypothetical protein